MRTHRIGLVLAWGLIPAAALAQQQPASPPAAADVATEDAPADEPDIVVTGSKSQPGAVIGDIPPEHQLGQADIRSYGVSSVADLLNELSPQTTSGRGSGGAPVVLLNGRRISSFAEIRDLPTEAIARVDILPEEVALKYGYRADQKVVNFVLRRRFRAATLEAADRIATAGGRNSPQGELDLLSIRRDQRVNLHLEYQTSSALVEADRAIAPQAGGIAALDQRPFRTLLPATSNFSANAIYARPFGKIVATLNGRIELTDSRASFGLPTATLTIPAASPFAASLASTTTSTVAGFASLGQRNSAINTHLGTTFNGDIGKWRWSATGNYDRSDTKSFTDNGIDTTGFEARLNANDPTADPRAVLRASDFGVLPANRAFSSSSVAGGDVLFNGAAFGLPAGPVATSVRLGASTSNFSSRSFRNALAQSGQVSRDLVNGQLNVDLPIASRAKGFLGSLGQLSANFNLAADHLSDFGTLTTLGYGANWSPVDAVRVLVSVTDQDRAPTAQQLGNPSITTPNVRVFDYVRGTTATVTTVSGGNGALAAENNRVTKIGLTLKPWHTKDLTLTANYVTSSSRNPIAAFPTPTAALEAAFPDRFARDAAGQLVRIDQRPINFARSARSQLRWGIDFSQPLKSKIQKEFEAFRAGTGPNPFAGLNPPGGGGGVGASGARGPDDQGGRGAGAQRSGSGFRGGGGGGFGGFGGRGQGGGRLQFALYHTWHFIDRVDVAQGGPRLDLLNGDAIGGSGGQSRHEVEGQAGYSNNGLGARLSVDWRSGTNVNGGTAAAPQTLSFSGLATANLRLFGDLGQRLEWVKAHPWLRGTRVSLSVENIFDGRQRVTDASGAVPVSYQPDYLDPLGRTVRLSIRKLFF